MRASQLERSSAQSSGKEAESRLTAASVADELARLSMRRLGNLTAKACNGDVARRLGEYRRQQRGWCIDRAQNIRTISVSAKLTWLDGLKKYLA